MDIFEYNTYVTYIDTYMVDSYSYVKDTLYT